MSQLWLVCYDVRDNKRRAKLAKLLEQRCERVQYSVFECPLEERLLEKLLHQRWLAVLEIPEDSLRVYPLDARAKAKARVFGSPPPYEPPDFLIF